MESLREELNQIEKTVARHLTRAETEGVRQAAPKQREAGLKALDPGASEEEVEEWADSETRFFGLGEIVRYYWPIVVKDRERERLRRVREAREQLVWQEWQ
jgi:hypothetical protein